MLENKYVLGCIKDTKNLFYFFSLDFLNFGPQLGTNIEILIILIDKQYLKK